MSAVALVALGIAGWLLQARAQDIHEQTAKQEQQERRYLPMLRTLLELEIVLQRSANSLRHRSSTDERFDDIAYAVGADLEAAAHSLFTPDGDPIVSLHTPAQVGILSSLTGEQDKLVSMPLKAAVLMYSQILTSQAFLRELPPGAKVTLDKQATIIYVQAQNTNYILSLNPAATNAWRAWMTDTPIPVTRLKYANVPFLLQELRFATAAIAHDTLSKHADLGDRYVSIRNDVLHSKSTNEGNDVSSH